MGLLFAGIDCLVERERATKDILNSVIAGGVTGGALGGWAARQMGPQSTCHSPCRSIMLDPCRIFALTYPSRLFRSPVLLKNTAKGAAGFAVMAVVFEKAIEHFTE